MEWNLKRTFLFVVVSILGAMSSGVPIIGPIIVAIMIGIILGMTWKQFDLTVGDIVVCCAAFVAPVIVFTSMVMLMRWLTVLIYGTLIAAFMFTVYLMSSARRGSR